MGLGTRLGVNKNQQSSSYSLYVGKRQKTQPGSLSRVLSPKLSVPGSQFQALGPKLSVSQSWARLPAVLENKCIQQSIGALPWLIQHKSSS